MQIVDTSAREFTSDLPSLLLISVVGAQEISLCVFADTEEKRVEREDVFFLRIGSRLNMDF